MQLHDRQFLHCQKNPPPYGGGENSVVFQETTASYWSRLRTELLFWFAWASMD